jgi:hypothetical protein
MGQVYLPSIARREPVRRPSGRRSGGSDLAVLGTEVPTRGCQLEYFGRGPSISAKYLETLVIASTSAMGQVDLPSI